LIANYRSFDLNPSSLKRFLTKSLRKHIQLAIVEADVQLESLKRSIVLNTNRHINGVQHKLFLLSMWVDERMDN
jgi:hypothetical protein